MFTASVDGARGVIRIRGRVDRVAADVVARGVVALQEMGHRHIRVQSLTPGVLDPCARRVLDDLAQRLWARGMQLSLE